MSLRIGVLSVAPSVYTTRRLKEAGAVRGHEVCSLAVPGFALSIQGGETDLLYRGKAIERCDAICARIGGATPPIAIAVARTFELRGTVVVNSSEGITLARDKLTALQLLVRNKIPVPPSVYVGRHAQVQEALAPLGGGPLIVKFLHGTHGIGVMLAESLNTAVAIIEAMRAVDQEVVVQKLVGERRGRDLRAFVLDGRVVAAVERCASEGDFRSNLHRGGSTAAVTLGAAAEEIAVKAASALGLRVAGVDLIESHGGPLVLEVNASPGFEGLEMATGVDVAALLIERIEEWVRER